MLNSLRHVRASHLLDRDAFDFQALPPSRAAKDRSAGCRGGPDGAFGHADGFERFGAED